MFNSSRISVKADLLALTLDIVAHEKPPQSLDRA
jgi:hypothetical protein